MEKKLPSSSIRHRKPLPCVLLVCTLYSPHNHNIAFLRTQAERLDLRLVEAWPRELRKDRALFEKLKDAYVKARYSKHYRSPPRNWHGWANGSRNSAASFTPSAPNVWPRWKLL
jgi:hypothetical protein